MISFTLVTGNKGKLQEYQRLVPKNVSFDNVSIDLEEIQSFDSKVVIEHKVKQAYALVDRPVIVEDVSAGLSILNGLPGPFVKFFEQRLGRDALHKIVGDGDASATVSCTIGYYDGDHLLFAKGVIEGTIVSPRGDHGFGFDYCFQPNGQTKTFAEMTRPEKDNISHRALALKELLQKLIA